jgi:rhodanese-related sulfurtransferase
VQFGIVNTNHSGKFKSIIEAKNIQTRDLTKHLDLFKTNTKVFIMCRKGNESKKATEKILKETEYENVYNVEGGIEQIVK